jgi:hypothetical protein
MNTTDVQAQRRERLRTLMDEHRCWPFAHENGPKYQDYDSTYAELAGEYLGVEVNDAGDEIPLEGENAEIPRYAAISYDETYSMIDLCETLPQAIRAEGNVGEEYLMNPGGVIDLDTGERIETVTVVGMTREAFLVLCGLVQPNWLTSDDPDAVNHAGIYSEAWEELRETFPLARFREAVRERGEDFYHEEAGT